MAIRHVVTIEKDAAPADERIRDMPPGTFAVVTRGPSQHTIQPGDIVLRRYSNNNEAVGSSDYCMILLANPATNYADAYGGPLYGVRIEPETLISIRVKGRA